jgi:hypothetical protein
MAIQLLKDVPHEALVGKYICTPPREQELPCGWPARVEKATAARLTYRRLARGAWDEAAAEWQVRPTTLAADGAIEPEVAGSQPEYLYAERRDHCQVTSARFVCDTAAEAIALYTQALATQKGILAFRKVARAALDYHALNGNLPAPAYVASEA